MSKQLYTLEIKPLSLLFFVIYMCLLFWAVLIPILYNTIKSSGTFYILLVCITLLYGIAMRGLYFLILDIANQATQLTLFSDSLQVTFHDGTPYIYPLDQYTFLLNTIETRTTRLIISSSVNPDSYKNKKIAISNAPLNQEKEMNIFYEKIIAAQKALQQNNSTD